MAFLKQVNHGLPYNHHTQYMKKHGLQQFTMYHGMPWKTMQYHGVLCNSIVYVHKGEVAQIHSLCFYWTGPPSVRVFLCGMGPTFAEMEI